MVREVSDAGVGLPKYLDRKEIDQESILHRTPYCSFVIYFTLTCCFNSIPSFNPFGRPFSLPYRRVCLPSRFLVNVDAFL